MSKIPWLFANWKMAVSAGLARQLVDMTQAAVSEDRTIVLCPPFPLIPMVTSAGISAGAQTCAASKEPKMTGAVSAALLSEMGVKYVLAGHSERRSLFHETDQQVHEQCRLILEQGMTPILCVGETSEQRQANKTLEVVTTQLQRALQGLPEIPRLLVAYEPIWAIGGVGSMDAHEAGQMCAQILELVTDLVPAFSEHIHIIYGGSADAKNMEEMAQQGIVGFLVGTASQTVEPWKNMLDRLNSL